MKYSAWIIGSDGTRTRVEPVRRERPRICATCRATAEYVIVEPRRLVTIDRAGGVSRLTTEKGTFYCSLHVPT